MRSSITNLSEFVNILGLSAGGIDLFTDLYVRGGFINLILVASLIFLSMIIMESSKKYVISAISFSSLR